MDDSFSNPLDLSASGSPPAGCHRPCHLPQDLGYPIPDDPHAISVCLPTWKDVIGYEDGDPRVRQALRAGYPRFVLPPQLLAFHRQWTAATDDSDVLAFATPGAARRALDHVIAHGGMGERIIHNDIAVVRFADTGSRALGGQIWRYAGEGLSSRGVVACLAGKPVCSSAGDTARGEVAERIANWHGVPAAAVFLFASGMAAVATVHRFLCSQHAGAGTVQIDFPYVDVSHVQKFLGCASNIAMSAREAGDGALAEAFVDGFTAGVFCEVPANPLLECADLPMISAICRSAGVPVVADDTVASVANVALLPHADFVTTSLSKWFNGRCNLLAGAVIANPASPLAEAFAVWLASEDPAIPGDADAAELAVNSRGFEQRMRLVNDNGHVVATMLRAHPMVDRVCYPSLRDDHPYARVVRPGGGTGGLISFTLHGGEPAAERFYDAVALDKGPSLGADFSMLCPYTLLAHYEELDHAQAWGVPRDLIRLSVGTEPSRQLAEILTEGLRHVPGR